MEADERCRLRSEGGKLSDTGRASRPSARFPPRDPGDGLDYFRGLVLALPIGVALWLVVLALLVGGLLLR